MQGGQGAGGAAGLLQNQKVQIGIIAAAAVILLVVVYLLFFRGGAPAVQTDTNVSPGLATGGAAAPAGLGGATTQAPAGQQAATAPVAAPTGGPRPVNRSDPFLPNPEVRAALASIPETVGPSVYSPRHQVYLELNPHRAEGTDEDEEGGLPPEGPPIPPMRVSGVLRGKVVSVLMQVANQHVGPLTPGEMVLDTFRVERIEPDQVILSREYDDRRGRPRTQIIEVPLAGVPRGVTGGGPRGFGGGVPGDGGGG